MTPQLLVVILVCIFAVIFGQPLLALLADYGIPLLKATRRRYLRVEWHGVMSRIADEDQALESNEDLAISLDETNSETAETPQRVAEIQAESFTLGETAALARLVAQNKLGLTDAVKIGADAKSGEKYQKRSRDIKAAVDRIQEKYPQRTPEQEKLRSQLGIAKP